MIPILFLAVTVTALAVAVVAAAALTVGRWMERADNEIHKSPE